MVRRMISCCLMKIFGRDLAGPLPPRSHPRPNLVLDAFFKGESRGGIVGGVVRSKFLCLGFASTKCSHHQKYWFQYITLFAALSELFTIAVLGSILSFWS